MRKLNKKGFTLIELLAVIVILGILMIVAIPMVTRYIQQSRQDAFIDTAKAYINAARYAFMNGDLKAGGVDCALSDGNTYYVAYEHLKVENSGGKSSFNNDIDTKNSYVKVKVTTGGEVTYSTCMSDGKYATTLKEEKELQRSDVKPNNSCILPPPSGEGAVTACTP